MAPSQSTWNPQPSTLDKKIDSKRVDCTYDCICIGLTAQFTAWFPQLNETGRGLILLGSSDGNIIVIINLGQFHQKSPEVNSFRVLFYLGKNSGKVTLLISATKVFTPVEFFGAYIQEGKIRRDLADQRDVFSFISLLFLTLSQRARWRKAKT